MAGRVQNLKPWPKGVSGNPGGRPKRDLASEIAQAVFENNPNEIYAAMLRALKKGNPRVALIFTSRHFVGMVVHSCRNVFRVERSMVWSLKYFNGDGKPDLVLTWSSNFDQGFNVYLDNGDGTFRGSSTLTRTIIVSLADLNGDSKLDLISAGTTVGVWYGNGDGTFQSPVASLLPFGFSVVADLNGDCRC